MKWLLRAGLGLEAFATGVIWLSDYLLLGLSGDPETLAGHSAAYWAKCISCGIAVRNLGKYLMLSGLILLFACAAARCVKKRPGRAVRPAEVRSAGIRE